MTCSIRKIISVMSIPPTQVITAVRIKLYEKGREANCCMAAPAIVG